MTELTVDQLECACDLVETRCLDRGSEASTIIAELCANELKRYIDAAALTAAYNKWKRAKRFFEDNGDELTGAMDPETLEAPRHIKDGGDAVREIIGRLLSYMGQSMLRKKYVWKASEIRLGEGESITRRHSPGCITLPCGTFAEWIICAILIQKDGVAVRALPECRYHSRCVRGGRETIIFERLTCVESEANMKALASSVGALQYLYFGGRNNGGNGSENGRTLHGHQITSARRLAAALGITVANISHHMRNMAAKNIAAGGQTNFAPLKSKDTLSVVRRLKSA